ncbi:hypothetical protein I203_103785 [Kwoniella mangroviensis CBS 8507]|uniref:uncharacterized protein n=1 Tax=Kwoniella mangroviensis CBS 8507 TaxID=1296122 RepID=UPI00080D4CE5|nr:uncharacterized protein I203_04122 [Kwoniella mangroviensis CBS 8507]OCF66546.1 hypothetical protein I203_04122 [Kwoniella mangroviensis CBS 8507]
MPPTNTTASPGPSKIFPASLSHFVIFNPNIRPDIPKSDNKDDDDDLREAAQILFYTSREAVGVSRDKMLRQVGLAKGLMGFGNMIVESSTKYTSIHGNRSRLIIFSPEPDFYIYMCITLSHLDNEKKDPVNGSQGISDEMLVNGLAKGYADFRLLHGPFSSHTIPSASLSTVLDKYFTRFAFQFESTYLSSPSLTNWLEGYPPISLSADLLEGYRSDLEGLLIIVGPKGPLYKDEAEDNPALIRYLHNLVQLTLPPPTISQPVPTNGDRHTMSFGLNLGLGGLGRKTQNSRKSSWTTLGGWVPEIKRGSNSTSTSPSPTPDIATRQKEGVDVVPKGKWGFGLGGIGDAMGNMGNVFGLARPSTPTSVQVDSQDKEAPLTASASRDGQERLTEDSNHPHHVEPASVVVEELEAAVEPDEEIEWEGKNVWIKSVQDGVYEKRRACWVIRNDILVSVILPKDAAPPYTLPNTKATTYLFKRLTGQTSPEPLSTSNNPCIALLGQDKMVTKGELDGISDQALINLKSAIQNGPDIHEIFAKSTSNRFLVAKKSDQLELYMKVGGDDSSLTDADHAVRTFIRLNGGISA